MFYLKLLLLCFNNIKELTFATEVQHIHVYNKTRVCIYIVREREEAYITSTPLIASRPFWLRSKCKVTLALKISPFCFRF